MRTTFALAAVAAAMLVVPLGATASPGLLGLGDDAVRLDSRCRDGYHGSYALVVLGQPIDVNSVCCPEEPSDYRRCELR